MRLPSIVEEIVEEACSGIPLSSLIKQFHKYSEAYREGKESKRSLPSELGKICYLATRLPATFAAVSTVLREAKRKIGTSTSLLDLGAGPGTTLISAIAEGYQLDAATLIEENKDFITMGRRWTPSFAHWRHGDLLKQETFPSAELVTFAYSLGEIPEGKRKNLLKTAWEACQKALIIIEPGTPRAFKSVLDAREVLIELGGHVVAPCPHNDACPMPKNDWCHFSVRFERTSLHRRIKEAELGYEDEKFCYVVVAKHKFPSESRVIKTSQKNSGHVLIKLCTEHGIIDKLVSKKDGELFKKAKKIEWGEAYCLEE